MIQVLACYYTSLQRLCFTVMNHCHENLFFSFYTLIIFIFIIISDNTTNTYNLQKKKKLPTYNFFLRKES